MNRLQVKHGKNGLDVRANAKAAGLRYISDSTPGYSREATNNGFRYRDADGKIVRSKALIDRFNKLVIPPAYKNVWISPIENGHLLFTGLDAAGRKQYRYHTAWNQLRNHAKYDRMQLFASFLPMIRTQVDRDLRRRDLHHDKVVALVVRLMELTSIRIGNKCYRRLYGSYGLTTLQDRHVKIDGANLKFEFKGKKGIVHRVHLYSKRMARLVKQCRDIPGKELFQYYDENGQRQCVDSGDVNEYLKKITAEDFTAKDFRTWAGSVSALYAFKEAGEFTSVSDCKKKIVNALDEVAINLGNTRTVCKKYYVHPAIIKSYEEGSIYKYLENLEEDMPADSAELSLAEKALIELVTKERIELAC